MTSEINFESKNEFKKLARAKEYSKYLQRPGDLKNFSLLEGNYKEFYTTGI